ncbi:uncharacterized protein TNCV_2001101 [Trichonephila clavipes]|nr:uncharacterized protein TNCV_2001101 [Trichonephila clavipes]
MHPASRCMSGNTCGGRISWTHYWTSMVPQINTRGDRVLYAMAPYTITQTVGAVCRCKTKAGLRRSPRGHHTRTRLSSLLRLHLGSTLKMTWFQSPAVQFPRAGYHSKWRHRWVGVKGSTRNRSRDPKLLQPGALYGLRRHSGP